MHYYECYFLLVYSPVIHKCVPFAVKGCQFLIALGCCTANSIQVLQFVLLVNEYCDSMVLMPVLLMSTALSLALFQYLH